MTNGIRRGSHSAREGLDDACCAFCASRIEIEPGGEPPHYCEECDTDEKRAEGQANDDAFLERWEQPMSVEVTQ